MGIVQFLLYCKGSLSRSVKLDLKSEVKLEVKRQTCAETKGKGHLLGRHARFLRGNASETRFLRECRQEGLLSWVEKAASFGENTVVLCPCEESLFPAGGDASKTP